ncbi:MAG: type II secretion system protein [Lachnospiraceae bacterium]|nr:type II secretion system protein [Lachnospiraceae bacterium]
MRAYEKSGKNSGISLIELIIVVSIMAVLVGVLTPVFMKYINRARKSKDVVTADQIARAVNTAFVDNPEAYDAFQKWTGMETTVHVMENGTDTSYKVYQVAASGKQGTTPYNSNCFNGGSSNFGNKEGSTGFYGVINRELGLSTREMNPAIIPKYVEPKVGAGPKAGYSYEKLDRWRIVKRKSDGRLEIWSAQPNPGGGYPIYRVWPDPDDIYKN